MRKEVKNGECCDISEIVNDFYGQLKGYLIKTIHNTELAEDITQEVMLKLISAHNKSIKLHNIKAWLFEIARHTVADYYRDSKKLNKNEIDPQLEQNLIAGDDSEFSPSDYLVPMIKLLPVKYSEPLYLSDIENLPQTRVAEKMGLSISATKMRIQRARKMLYDLFVECCDIEYTKSGAFSHCTIKENCHPLLKAERQLLKNNAITFL